MNEDRIRRYIDRCDKPSVAQILGRFRLNPEEHYETIAAMLEHNNRACAQQGVPSESSETSQASYGRSEGQEGQNHKTEAGLPGLPGLPGDLTPPLPKSEGGRGVRARVVIWHPRKKAKDAGSEVMDE